MPVNTESGRANYYAFSNGKYKKVSEITQVEINTDDIDERELVKIRDKSALTVTVSIDDETMGMLKRLVTKGIRRRKKYLDWKRNRRYMRRRR